MTNDTTPDDGTPRSTGVTGETPVVRAVNDVPPEVLDELTTAFEKHAPDTSVPPVSPSAPTVVDGGTETVSTSSPTTTSPTRADPRSSSRTTNSPDPSRGPWPTSRATVS